MRVGDAVVVALPVAVSRPGERTTLSLRPERVLLGPEAEGADNRFEGTVRELVYHGDHLRVHLSVLGNEAFVLKLPNRPGAARPVPGERLRVGWRAVDCRALDAG
ncbi:hypothetical protein HRbin39_01669 [bacterium HR39]|nr:hypothetical protein HRbin39_01669 [bacterium HR39]